MPLEHWQLGAIIFALQGSLCQCLKTLMAKNFQSFSLNLLWCSFVPFPCILLLIPRSRARQLPFHFPPQEAAERWGHLRASFSPDQTTQISSASPHRTCLPALVPVLVPLLEAFRDLIIHFIQRSPKLHALWKVRLHHWERDHTLVGKSCWLCWVYCTPKCDLLPGMLLAHTEPTVSSTPSSLAAELLLSHSSPICTWVWHCSIPGTAPDICLCWISCCCSLSNFKLWFCKCKSCCEARLFSLCISVSLPSGLMRRQEEKKLLALAAAPGAVPWRVLLSAALWELGRAALLLNGAIQAAWQFVRSCESCPSNDALSLFFFPMWKLWFAVRQSKCDRRVIA